MIGRKAAFYKQILTVAVYLSILLFGSIDCAIAASPQLAAIANESASQGATYTKTPVLSAGSNVTWTKEFGPDDMTVDPTTGTVFWVIPATLPREAFHLGVRATNSEGSTYITWILKVGGGNFVYVGSSETYTTISAGTAAMSSGDTLVIRDGTYTGAANMIQNDGASRGTLPPSGSAAVYSTVMAEHPGGVTIDGQSVSGRFPFGAKGTYASRDYNAGAGDALGTYNVTYISAKGIVFKDGDDGAVFVNHVNHLKFIDCGAYTTVSTYNAPITIFRSGYSLVEGCYVWGSGRMRIMFYICDYSIMRRNVGRLDHVSPGDPIGGWDLYSCQHCRTQNNIMVDSDQFSHYINYTNDAGIWVDQSGSSNGETWSVHIDNIHRNSIALNNDMGLSLLQNRTDGDPFNLQNSVAWDIRAIPNGYGDDISFMLFTLCGPSIINQGTFGKLSSPYYSMVVSWNNVSGAYLRDYTDSAHTTTNNIFYDLKAYDGTAAPVFENINSADHNNTWLTGAANGLNSTVTNTINADPTATTGAAANSLKYLTRIEPGGALLTAGASGARVGANVLTMAGKSGTLWGDTGYDTDYGYPMWPFPHEDLIKTKMAAYSYSDSNGTVTGTRGFCAGTSRAGLPQTLTRYIWEYLGNTIPSTIYAAVTDPDTTPPAVSMTSPAGGTTLIGTAALAATATDNMGVAKVEFYANSTFLGTSFTAPFAYNWDTTTATNGSYTVTAKAYDTSNNTTLSAGVAITVNNPPPDTTAPSVTAFSLPATANNFTVPISSFTATDNVAVTGYSVTTTNSSSGCTWSTSQPTTVTFTALGSQTAWAWAKDAAGNVSSAASASTNVNVTTFTFGETTVLTGDDSGNGNLLLAQSATLPLSATIQSISFYVGTASGKLRLGIYDATGTGGKPGRLLAATAEITPTVGWNTAAVVTPVALVAGNYWLAYLPSSGSLHFRSTSSGSAAYYSYTYAALPTAYSSSPTSTSVHWSLYATVTTNDVIAPSVTSFTLPATSSSLTVPVSAFTATDNLAVTGYLITESATAPSAAASGWSSTAPSGYTFSSSGAHTVYAWAKDAAGNVSASSSASVTVTTLDTTAPTVTAFTMPSTATSLTVSVSSFTATDNVGVAGYLVNESASAPSASDSGWSGTVPASYAFAAAGARTAYAWAKDASGNVSTSRSTTVTITIPDTTVPTITAFSMPLNASSLTVAVSGFTATDNVSVTGYLITESSTAPSASASGWSATAPASFTFAAAGVRTAYAWVKDAAGNVSTGSQASVTITLPDTTAPMVTAFSMPATAGALSVTVSSFTASDNTAVTGYQITESAIAPSASASGWSATAPSSFTFSGSGARTAYAWAKDAAGNVSAGAQAAVTITIADTTAPSVNTFVMPATATSLTVAVSSFTASDNVAVTGFLITGTATAPLATASGWSGTAPSSYTFSGSGTRTAYAWAKDAAGNVSVGSFATVTITLPDTTAPTVSAFTMPTTATSLTVAVSSFTATDNVAVTGYLITATATAPLATASGWSATAPASYTFAGSGARTAYAWAKDAAGNVSASKSKTVTITLPDTTAPTVTTFSMPTSATALTVSVSGFTATDDLAVTGYLVTESATAPLASASGWSASAPSSFTFAGSGVRTAYAWAKDAAGNVSTSRSAGVVITIPDNTAPTVTAFSMPATATALAVSVSSLTATDNVAVSGYLITESATAPSATTSGWSTSAPASFTFAAAGTRTAYAWAKDAAGNISASFSATVTITLPDTIAPTVTVFSMPTVATSTTVTVSGFTATDNLAVTGYLITESATAPSASASGWSAGAPSFFTFAGTGVRTAYAWAKDAAGNVSTSRSAGITITLPDTTAPTVTAFSLPAAAASLTVSVSSFTATDNVSVTGYLITESATAPSASTSGWSATAPSSYTFAAAGTRTAYAWAKDVAGNVSASSLAQVTITLPDTTAPTVTSFGLPATATSLTVMVSSFTATDNVAVTGYLITATATAPAATASGWSASAPSSFTFAGSGSRTAYAWAKDAAGNVSASSQAQVTITLPDTTVPVITAFTMPLTASAFTVSVLGLTATDNVAVTGYLITESATAPSASASGWSATAPVSYTFSGAGVRTAYAFAKDAAGNVSASSQAQVTITLPDMTAPTVTAFVMPAAANSTTVSVTSFTATDNTAVTGYLINESALAPSASDPGWSATAPSSFTFAAAGARTAYAWAKDAAGNVSLSALAQVTVTLLDTTAPSVTAFALPDTATSLTVDVTGFTASDDTAVTGYLITESATVPSAGAATWSALAPSTYTFATAGARTAYAWAKDAAGNVSASAQAQVTITLPDTTAPVVTDFTLPSAATSLTVSVFSLSATDNVAVTGYLITESAQVPSAAASGWSVTVPLNYTFAATGTSTAYAWAKDGAGNVSASAQAQVTITLPDTVAPTITAFTMPAIATSLTVSVSTLAASDDVAVTGYLITESATAPSATTSGWSASAPASYTFVTPGTRTAFAWAKDAAGNISLSASATVTITLPDTTAPAITAFSMPGSAASLSVPVTLFTATDNVAVAGYLITESPTAPSAGASGWSMTAPSSFTFTAAGARTAYAWAKDAAGNVSLTLPAAVTISLPDTIPPTITGFVLPASASSLTVTVSSFSATDNVGVTGYLINESATQPSTTASGWSAVAPGSYTFTSAGTRIAYAWAKDAAGNISASALSTVTITLPDTAAPSITAFSMPATAGNLTVAVSSLTAMDNVGVTGYLITESAAAPSADSPNWSASAPASFTFAAAGTRTAYSWTKDAAGNVSLSIQATVAITLPDTTAPAITDFTLPATASSLIVPVTSFASTDNIGVTGYLITESATTPSLGNLSWSSAVPANYTFAGSGVRTAFAWTRDAAGNISQAASAAVAITLVDTILPVVTGFSIPDTVVSLTVPVSNFSATDNVGVTGYLITESATRPAAGDSSWSVSPPASFTFTSAGARTAYAWAKDAAGNVSAPANGSVTINLPDLTAPTVTSFVIPPVAASLTVPISAFTASDEFGVTGYLITESATPPAIDAAGWTVSAPATFTLSSTGVKTLYGWAKDAAGHVSASLWGRVATAGALNENGVVTIDDALFALNVALGTTDATTEQRLRCDIAPLDVNGTVTQPNPDGKVNVDDVIVLLRLAAGLSW